MVKRWMLWLLGVLDMAEFDTCPACGSEKRTRISPISDPIERVVCGDCGQHLSPVERHPGAAAHKACFTPLAAMVGLAFLDGMGINSSRVVDCSLHADSGPVAKLVVTFHVLPADLERVLQSLKAIPSGAEQ